MCQKIKNFLLYEFCSSQRSQPPPLWCRGLFFWPVTNNNLQIWKRIHQNFRTHHFLLRLSCNKDRTVKWLNVEIITYQTDWSIRSWRNAPTDKQTQIQSRYRSKNFRPLSLKRSSMGPTCWVGVWLECARHHFSEAGGGIPTRFTATMIDSTQRERERERNVILKHY